MAFFDHLGRRASQATAKAVQKAQELSETTRLNTLISDEEKKIDNAYSQIGKLYVSLHRANPEEAFAGLVSSIAASEETIRRSRERIQDLRGVQRCTQCGAEIPIGVAFCSSCGNPAPRAEAPLPEGSIQCEGCGSVIESGMRFCTVCGKPVPQPATPVVPTAGNVSVSGEVCAAFDVPVNMEPQVRICPGCGARLEGWPPFCTECGTKL